MPVVKISFSFQLSGIGDGLTLSFEIVMIIPGHICHVLNEKLTKFRKEFDDVISWKIPVRSELTVI